MNKDEFVKAVFEKSFGDNARPPDMVMNENDPNYRTPFSYEETFYEIYRCSDLAYIFEKKFNNSEITAQQVREKIPDDKNW